MTDSHSFNHCYLILNLSQDSDWETCKQAYKKSVKRWHPDKFTNDKKTQLTAEEKLKDINIAYTQLGNYFQQYGVLPGSHRNNVDQSSSQPHAHQNFDLSSLYENLNSEISAKNGSFKKYPYYLLLSLVIIITYTSFSSNTETPRNSTIPNKQHNTIAVTQARNINTIYFTYGSTVNEVINSQGLPDKKISNIWYYGDSWILFKNNTVNDWHNGQQNPLNISLDTSKNRYSSKMNNINVYIKKGDSKLIVREIQGQPIRKSKNVWYYEISKVYFKNNKVVSWFNSPLDPLRIPE